MTLSVPDRLDLMDLVHRYAAMVDEGDPAGVAALFTDDGVLATPRPPRHLDPVDEAVGPAAIEAALNQLSGMAVTQHALVGLVLDVDGEDSVRGRVACIAHHVHPDGTDLVWRLTYRDLCRRTDAGWRFARRDLHVDVVEKRSVTAARGLATAPPLPSTPARRRSSR